jgi:ubiquinone/menaquinone biosynthesis C-methylase UbiE
MPVTDRSQWFHDHYVSATDEILTFFAGDGLELGGQRVADIGCGDGIIDLGVTNRAGPAHLVGFDLRPTDVDLLAEVAHQEGVAGGLPNTLEFRTVSGDRLPCDDGYFDRLFSWSAFEHVLDPVRLAQEMRRVLRPGGVAMVQVWPFYHSEHGSHLWQWFPEGFAQLLRTPEELIATVEKSPGTDPVWAEYLIESVRSLNGITVDGLQIALRTAGFQIAKVEILSPAFHVPPGLADVPLSRLAIAGVKLLAGG